MNLAKKLGIAAAGLAATAGVVVATTDLKHELSFCSFTKMELCGFSVGTTRVQLDPGYRIDSILQGRHQHDLIIHNFGVSSPTTETVTDTYPESGWSYDSYGDKFEFDYSVETGRSEIGKTYTMVTYDDGAKEKFFLHGSEYAGNYVAIDMESGDIQTGSYELTVSDDYRLVSTDEYGRTLTSFFPAHTLSISTYGSLD